MKKIINYEIITSESWDYVVRMVKDGINQGWQPLGSLTLSSYVNDDEESYTTYGQAMVMYEDEE